MLHLVDSVTYKSARRGTHPVVVCTCGLKVAGHTDAEAARAFRDHLDAVLPRGQLGHRKQAPKPPQAERIMPNRSRSAFSEREQMTEEGRDEWWQ